jgi:L-idonate 5-dehydrogenase
MLQVKILEPRRIVCEEVEKPTAKVGEAVIQVDAVGICGSDMHVYLGQNPVFKPPHVPGHEFGGRIKSLGGEQSRFRVGAKVAVNPLINCGSCYYCTHAAEHLCENQQVIGGTIAGSMKQEIAVPVRNLVPLPADFDMTLAPFIEPVAVAVHSFDELKNRTVLIVGLGTMGLCTQLLCRKNGNRIISTDISEYCQQLSRQLGADFVFDFRDPDAASKMAEFLGKDKIDLAVLTFCSKETLDFAIKVVKKSGEIRLIGLPGEDYAANATQMLLNELTLSSTYQYRDSQYRKAAEYVIKGKLNLGPLATKIFPLQQAAEAFQHKLTKPAVKIILKNEAVGVV